MALRPLGREATVLAPIRIAQRRPGAADRDTGAPGSSCLQHPAIRMAREFTQTARAGYPPDHRWDRRARRRSGRGVSRRLRWSL